ncbi:MAG TPA: amidohydrolase family protein [Cellvibrio sp.]|nr:amidohydrolase family protein [Cellvibrio sp.]
MKILIVILLALLLSSCINNVGRPIDYIFENVHVIPMDKPEVLHNRAIIVDDGKIISVVKQAEASHVNALVRIDGKGKYVMPGLADMHVHVRWNPEKMFDLFLANGITTVVNMRPEDGGYDHLALRNNVLAGELAGPRYLLSGHHLQGEFPKDIEEVTRILDEQTLKKISFVKIHGDLKPEIYNAILKGAKERGLKVVGHAQHKMSLNRTLEMDALEHAEELLYVATDERGVQEISVDFLTGYRANVSRLLNPAQRKKVVDQIAASGIYLDPTLIVYKMVGVWQSDEHLAVLANDPDMAYLPEDIKAFWLNPATNPYQEEGFPITRLEVEKNLQLMQLLIKELHHAGVPLLSGSDTFGTLVPGISLHQELKLLVDAGLTPYEALRCSTVNVAAYLNESHVAGMIKPGFRADFILLKHNPLSDINNSRSVNGVFTQGKWFSRSELEKNF